MTVLTIGAVATIATCGAAAPIAGAAATATVSGAAAGASAAAGAAAGVAATAASTAGAAATVAGSAGLGAAVGATAGAGAAAAAGASAGAIAGAGAVGSAVGSAAAAGASSASIGTAALTGGIAAGPIGWIVLGADECKVTFDCWKPILRDTSQTPSSGLLLKEVIQDSRVQDVIIGDTPNEYNLPSEITLINIWGEKFGISYVTLPWNNQLVAHASPIN